MYWQQLASAKEHITFSKETSRKGSSYQQRTWNGRVTAASVPLRRPQVTSKDGPDLTTVHIRPRNSDGARSSCTNPISHLARKRSGYITAWCAYCRATHCR